MPVPFGFGVGDFVAVGTLAWSVYKSCKTAPGSFDNISMEVLSLHAVLKEGEEILFTRPLPPARFERLKIIKEGCEKVLADLQSLVDKYETLGTKSKRTWDRMRYGNEDIAEIRARLTSNITILTAFISTSQISVEIKLHKFIEECRQGKNEGSVASLQTVDSLSADDRAVWRTIRKELEEIGISLAAFDANREFIFDWFARAVETGAFEEQSNHEIDDENDHSEEQESPSHDEKSSESAPDAKPKVPMRNHKKLKNPVLASTPTAPKERTRVPLFAVLLARVSRPRQRLDNAMETMDVSKAFGVLRDEASFRLLDLKTLDRALWSATRHKGYPDPRPLIAELITKGSNVNYISSEEDERTPLWNSVTNGSYDVVRLLVENGADVNYKGLERKFIHGSPEGALDFAPRVSLTKNTAILKLLLSSGVDVHAQYRLPNLLHDVHEVTLMHEAALRGAVAAMQTLIEFGAGIDTVSPRHGTALMLAIWGSRTDAAQFLLAKGADPNFGAASNITYESLNLFKKMKWGPFTASYKSPLEAAIRAQDSSMVKLMLEHGAVPDQSTVNIMRDWAPRRIRSSYESADAEKQISSMIEDALKHGE